MRLLKQSTAYDLMVFMTDSADHVTGKTGLTLTITASKAGAAFASISPTVTERGSGWYDLALTTSHTDTLGDLALHVTATGADPTDLVCQVRLYVLGDTLPANVTQINSDANAAAAQSRAALAICVCTATTGASTTSIPTSSMTPAAAVTDQFKGRVVIFDRATTTTALRNQATDITASTSGGTLTVSALSTAPASGDTFIIV
jgi:hypothetical protein